MKDRPVCSLRDLARARLARQAAEPEEESEQMKRLRAEGWVILGSKKGFVLLPALED